MSLSTAKKLRLTKETLRTLSKVDLRAVIGGTDAAEFSDVDNCIDLMHTKTCVVESDDLVVDVNPNVLIGVNTLRRF